MKSVRLLIKLSRPIFILLAGLLYILGIGISRYISGEINWTAFFLGLSWVLLILLGGQYLNEYFDPDSLLLDAGPKRTPFSGSSGAIGTNRLPRQAALWAGLSCLTIAASLTVLMFQYIYASQAGLLILGLFLAGELFFVLPPLRLIDTDYGEVSMAILRVGLIPALAFLWQGHEFHRLLIMTALPLMFLYLGMLVAMEFPDYAADLKQGRKSILIRIGWQHGMTLHNLLVLGSFLLFGIAFVFGLPLRIAWPIFLVLPVGVFQIWLMNRIGDGAKPNWNLLVSLAISSFSLTAYIIAFTFWIQ